MIFGSWRYGQFLETVEVDGSSVATYVYDGLKKRRKMTDDAGAETWWRWNSGAVLAAYGEGAGTWDIGTLDTTYIGKLGHSAGSDPSAGTYGYYHTNHLRSIAAVSDTDKTRVAAQRYLPYGGAQHAFGAAQAMGYTGHFEDAATGLKYAPFRYYNPATARWLKRAPLGMVDGPNMYAYVGGNPANRYDPLGRQFAQGIPGGDPTFSDPDAIADWTEDYLDAQPSVAIAVCSGGIFSGAAKACAGAVRSSGLLARGAIGFLKTRPGQWLFRPGSWLNSGRYLRIGIGHAPGGRRTFRIGGEWVQKCLGKPKHDLFDMGPL